MRKWLHLQWLRWRRLRRFLAPPVAFMLCAFVLLCMAMAQTQFLLRASESGQSLFTGEPLVALCRALASVGFAAWIVFQCEHRWVRAGKLDWWSFRRDGWSRERTLIVLCSCMVGLLSLHRSGFFEAAMLVGPAIEIQSRVVIACGYAMWCVVALSVLWSAVNSIDGGGDGFQGALVPRSSPSPRLRLQHALIPA